MACVSVKEPFAKSSEAKEICSQAFKIVPLKHGFSAHFGDYDLGKQAYNKLKGLDEAVYLKKCHRIVKIKGIPLHISSNKLRAICSKFGTVCNAALENTPQGNTGFVLFQLHTEAFHAAKDLRTIDGKVVNVHFVEEGYKDWLDASGTNENPGPPVVALNRSRNEQTNVNVHTHSKKDAKQSGDFVSDALPENSSASTAPESKAEEAPSKKSPPLEIKVSRGELTQDVGTRKEEVIVLSDEEGQNKRLMADDSAGVPPTKVRRMEKEKGKEKEIEEKKENENEQEIEMEREKEHGSDYERIQKKKTKEKELKHALKTIRRQQRKIEGMEELNGELTLVNQRLTDQIKKNVHHIEKLQQFIGENIPAPPQKKATAERDVQPLDLTNDSCKTLSLNGNAFKKCWKHGRKVICIVPCLQGEIITLDDMGQLLCWDSNDCSKEPLLLLKDVSAFDAHSKGNLNSLAFDTTKQGVVTTSVIVAWSNGYLYALHMPSCLSFCPVESDPGRNYYSKIPIASGIARWECSEKVKFVVTSYLKASLYAIVGSKETSSLRCFNMNEMNESFVIANSTESTQSMCTSLMAIHLPGSCELVACVGLSSGSVYVYSIRDRAFLTELSLGKSPITSLATDRGMLICGDDGGFLSIVKDMFGSSNSTGVRRGLAETGPILSSNLIFSRYDSKLIVCGKNALKVFNMTPLELEKSYDMADIGPLSFCCSWGFSFFVAFENGFFAQMDP
eukprot:Nk52_evm16s293 gene=Nk52_evmTU16s293